MKGVQLMKTLVLVASLAGMTLAGFADSSYYYWRGGDGDWTDPAHWRDESGNPCTDYPNSKEHTVVFLGVDVSVRLTESVSASRIAVQGETSVTLGGGGTITTSDVHGYDQSGANRIIGSLTLNDVTLCIPGSRLYVSGRLTLNEGSSLVQKVVHAELIDSPDADILINGGTHSLASLYINSPNPGTTMHVKGGSLNLSSTLYIGGGSSSSNYSGNRLEITGGRVTASTLSCDPDVSLLLDGGTLSVDAVTRRGEADLAVRSGTLASWNADVRNEFRIAGPGCAFELTGADRWFGPNGSSSDSTVLRETAVVTNGNGTVTLRGHWFGRGSFIASRLWMEGSFAYLDCRNIVLGTGVIQQGNTDVTIYNDITFGAFGDWATDAAATGNTTFFRCCGDVTVDTLDWFDRTTTRNISLLYAWPDDGIRWEVKGGGTFTYGSATRYWNYDYAPIHVMREVEVKEGTTLVIRRNGVMATDRLKLGAGTTLRVMAGDSWLQAGEVEADPTARFEVVVESGAVSGNNVPLLTGGFGDIDLSRVTVSGADASKFTLRSVAGTIFLDNGVQPSLPETAGNSPAIWTGVVDNDWCKVDNWHMSSTSYPWNWRYAETGKYPEFSGTRNTEVTFTDDKAATDLCPFFGLEAGPFSLDATRSDFAFRSWGNNYYGSVPNATVGSKSKYPAALRKLVSNWESCCSLFADSPAYIEASAGVVTPRPGGAANSSPGHLYVYGEVRTGGASSCNSLTLQAQKILTTHARQKATRLAVLRGSTLTVNANAGTMGNSALVVQKGATATFAAGGEAVYDFAGTEQNNTVEGTLNVNCPFKSTGTVRFYGDGNVRISGVRNPGVSGRAALALGCGIGFESDGWVPADGAADYAHPIVATNGLSYLTASKAWTYGVASDYGGPVAAADRALQIGLGAHLVIASTNGYDIAFADDIVGQGELEFAEGARISLAGAKAASFDAGRWVEIARVGTIAGTPVVMGGLSKTQLVDNGDGTVSLFAKAKRGTLVIFR